MTKATITKLPNPSGFSLDPPTEVLRSGARRLIEQAVEAEDRGRSGEACLARSSARARGDDRGWPGAGEGSAGAGSGRQCRPSRAARFTRTATSWLSPETRQWHESAIPRVRLVEQPAVLANVAIWFSFELSPEETCARTINEQKMTADKLRRRHYTMECDFDPGGD